MGNAIEEQGRLEEAIEAYKKAVLIEPDNKSVRHMIASLTGEKTETAPPEYVENLFDGYAKKFEASLVNKLEYKTPKLIRNILIKSNDNQELGSVLDLGCGTGLFGTEIKNYFSKLEGIDLSKKMLSIAKQKNVYDKLTQIDIVEYLSTMPLNFDYYIACDVFVYVGKLNEIFRLIKFKNKKPGHLVFQQNIQKMMVIIFVSLHDIHIQKVTLKIYVRNLITVSLIFLQITLEKKMASF